MNARAVRKLLRILAGLGGAATTLFAFLVTHLPAPSGVGTSEASPSRRVVRGVWHHAGELVHGLQARGLDAPAFLDPLLSDKTIHFAIFLAPGFFWSLTLGRGLDRRSAPIVVLLLALWAGLDEGSQQLVSREGELFDWVANVGGAAVGVALGWGLVRGLGPRSGASPPGSLPDGRLAD